MNKTRRDFLRTSIIGSVGGVLFSSRLEAKVKGNSSGHHGYFKKGSESYREILKLANQVIDGNNERNNAYACRYNSFERTFRLGSIVESYDSGHQYIDLVDALVEDNNGDGKFNKGDKNKGDKLSFHVQVEGHEIYGELFPSFVHIDNGIQVQLPQKVLELLEPLRQSMGGKVSVASLYGQKNPKQVPLKHKAFDRGGDKLIEQIKDAYLVEMMQTYQTFWRSLHPME